ncbi:hypothetical protein [Brevundimonas sp.]|uniref:hypothetical protein n=1 Tax=Brevundimonas sp. TaxID=1871086 RepID=UPI0017B29492|nr:hypothetical protein [Brevundimonas sp.]MBA4806060.1 hypothetical protein [Brevundimonas sp.]
MRRTNGIFTQRERRLAALAAIVVVAVTLLTLITGGLFSPSAGTGGRAGYRVADLPGVMDARPLG